MSTIDHVAFAMPRNSAKVAIEWYENVLGLKRFVINQEDDPFQGFTVRVGSMGMRMFSSVYWKCSETGCGDAVSKLKFVFAESLIDPDSDSSDQITTFIARHNGQPGLQHIAFTCINSIKEVVRLAKANGAQFLSPCSSYYSQNNGRAIEAAGENVAELCELGILLDDEADNWKTENTMSKLLTRVLLQIFTRSIFDNDTFFLELIERRGACGFGAGNVRT
ncbi:unnamed protein product [Rotaria sp. Silwood2]|nr:unnamed protein product [Rotaria sp. Silwood2]CAF3349462.1 unnamed protein product [Rotaria sp. Silwood2]CAF4143318.1 unnamed protein product [Rotaria sp. Silwood2]